MSRTPWALMRDKCKQGKCLHCCMLGYSNRQKRQTFLPPWTLCSSQGRHTMNTSWQYIALSNFCAEKQNGKRCVWWSGEGSKTKRVIRDAVFRRQDLTKEVNKRKETRLRRSSREVGWTSRERLSGHQVKKLSDQEVAHQLLVGQVRWVMKINSSQKQHKIQQWCWQELFQWSSEDWKSDWSVPMGGWKEQLERGERAQAPHLRSFTKREGRDTGGDWAAVRSGRGILLS